MNDWAGRNEVGGRDHPSAGGCSAVRERSGEVARTTARGQAEAAELEVDQVRDGKARVGTAAVEDQSAGNQDAGDLGTAPESHEQAGSAAAEVLGLVADPDMPTHVADRLAAEIADWLTEALGGEWGTDVLSAPVSAGESDRAAILDAVDDHRRDRGWRYAVYLTDLPLLLRERPVVATASPERAVALVSLPALGGLQPHRRMRQMLRQLLDDLVAEPRDGKVSGEHRLSSRLTDLLAPVHRTQLSETSAVRYTGTRTRGWLRLMFGMVRTNRPWQLVFGLSSALAAAIATSAFGLSSTTIWMIADNLSPQRQLLSSVFSVALLVFWLVAAHGLWERGRRRSAGFRRLAALYNGSTLLTLGLGVGTMYVGLFLVNIGAAWFLLPPAVLASNLLHAPGAGTYVNLAWGFATMGVVAGALGSSLESDGAVRQAAYGYREEQRRAREAVQKGQQRG
ncbi:hypothetical protein [Bounagaea algeriensis]